MCAHAFVKRSRSRIGLNYHPNRAQRFSREKSNQATIADRYVLKRATVGAGEFITSSCFGHRCFCDRCLRF
jgi:hypothetical protein